MKKIAVFIKHYSIGKSSPVLCMLDFLSANYDTVDIYGQNVSCINAAVMNNNNVHFFDVPTSEKGLFSGILDLLYPKPKHLYEDVYENHIAFDPHGFVLCLSLFPDSQPIYYSLELYFKNNYYNLTYPKDLMKKERSSTNKIKGLIIQSEERDTLFRNEYYLSDKIPTFILPVTYLQSSDNNKSFFLRKKYNIGDDKKVVLHLGGIQEYYSCIELALVFSKINGCVLIFHGYSYGEYIQKLRHAIMNNGITNVIISDEVYEHIEGIDQILMSSDVGIAWYNNASPNLTTAGKSSGKISAYLRFGLPIITNNYPSSIDAIERTGCGVCVDNFDEIPEGVSTIVQNYYKYSDNCCMEYDKIYWFENYRGKLKKFIES